MFFTWFGTLWKFSGILNTEGFHKEISDFLEDFVKKFPKFLVQKWIFSYLILKIVRFVFGTVILKNDASEQDKYDDSDRYPKLRIKADVCFCHSSQYFWSLS